MCNHSDSRRTKAAEIGSSRVIPSGPALRTIPPDASLLRKRAEEPGWRKENTNSATARCSTALSDRTAPNAHHLSKDIQLNFHTLVDRGVALVGSHRSRRFVSRSELTSTPRKPTPGRTAWPKPLFDCK